MQSIRISASASQPGIDIAVNILPTIALPPLSFIHFDDFALAKLFSHWFSSYAF